MKRPMYVVQDESHPFIGPPINRACVPTFWYVVKSPNGKVMTTSEVFYSRSNAIRAARAFIRLIETQVQFSYWTGRVGEMAVKSELIR